MLGISAETGFAPGLFEGSGTKGGGGGGGILEGGNVFGDNAADQPGRGAAKYEGEEQTGGRTGDF